MKKIDIQKLLKNLNLKFKLEIIKNFRRTICCIIILYSICILNAYFGLQLNLIVIILLMFITVYMLHRDVCLLSYNRDIVEVDIDIQEFLENHYNNVFLKKDSKPMQKFFSKLKKFKSIILVLICICFSFAISFAFNDNKLILILLNPMLFLVFIFS